MDEQKTLANLLSEERTFAPDAKFVEESNAKASIYDEALNDIEFWEQQAKRLHWHTDWHTTLDWSNAPFAKWFQGGKLNVAVNCIDRHILNGLGDKIAFYFEGEQYDEQTFTYQEMQDAVCKAANAFIELGIKAGDRIAIYMPMIPEAIIAMLASARIGAVHSVVFGGFSAEALRSRIDDAGAVLVITADGQNRRGTQSPLKPAVDEAVIHTPSVKHVLVVKRTGLAVDFNQARDIWWHDIVEKQNPSHTPEYFDAEHPLFILYTSGTTGKPKGILHTTGGYLTQASFTHHNVFDHKPETDIYWCTADIGWVTGHSYIVYGPMSNAATQVIYEGTPDTPHLGRWWEIIEKYKVTIFYTAPTAIRTFMKWGDEFPKAHNLSSLRLLGSVGEPINPEAWIWYRNTIGSGKTPIVDTWWQTETGAIMISPLPGITHTKPGSAMKPLPGISADIVDDGGNSVPHGSGGYLVLRKPWPSMLRGIWGDDNRYIETYWSRFSGNYFAGDGAKWDSDGAIWLLGRVDDVMNVSGHRISTTEVESALVSHPYVAEAAVVGANDDTTGQRIVAFVILRATSPEGDDTAQMLREHVAHEIGPIAKPKQILLVKELPKTRSGKIMRRLLRDVAEERPLGDVTTLADASVMQLIADGLATHPSED
ncbi:MAG: acetate--CoA ligase [Candidatus Nanopelagicales bacterium]